MASTLRALLRPLSGDHSPYRMPWFRTGRGSAPIDQVHRLGLALERSDARGWGARTALLLRALLWPAVSTLRAIRMLRTHGPFVEAAHGVGRLAQFVQMLHCANFLNIDAEGYYAYQLFRPERRAWADQILQPFEADRVGQQALSLIPVNELDPKVAFFRRCRRLGIPTVAITATFAGGDLEEWMDEEREGLPQVDLLLKPCNGASGIGVEAWRFDPQASVWRRGALELDEAGLLERCRQLSRSEPYLVQPRLTNDPALAPFSSGALVTVRVVTCFPADGKPVELFSAIRMPVGSTDADNFNTGGISAPVARETGRLGPAVARDVRRGTWSRHPDTGAVIEGAELPRYREIVDLSLDAHAQFPEFRSIGWDVPLTSDGPILLEGNAIWGVEMAQMVLGRPLGPTVAPECLLEAAAGRRP